MAFAAADDDEMVAAMCWLEARSIPFADASMAQVVGAIREVRQHQMLWESTKANIEVSAMLKGFFRIRK